MFSTPNTELSNQEWNAIFESASQRNPDEVNSQWELLMAYLGLGPEYFLAIYEALRQGRWRNAKNPKAYIKTAAKREALKMGLLSEQAGELLLVDSNQIDGEQVSSDEILDFISLKRDSSDPIKGTDGVWRSGECWDREIENQIRDEQDENPSNRTVLRNEYTIIEPPSEEFKKLVDEINNITGPDAPYIHLHPSTRPDWAKWAQAAGFNTWEQQVLNFKAARISRERALKQQPDEISRKALQAAWKRFDRSGMNRLREAAKKNYKKNVPES